MGPISRYWQEKLTDGPSNFPILGQKQQGFCSSSQAPDRALKPVPEHRLARLQSACCQGSTDEESTNNLQLALFNGNIPRICPVGGIAIPGSYGNSQDTVLQTQKPKGGCFDLLCSMECITAIDQPVSTKYSTSLQTDDLVDGGFGNRGQELTLSLDSMVERLPESELSCSTPKGVVKKGDGELGSMIKRFSGSELSCATPKGVVNKGDGEAARIVSASEQLQDEKLQDEKLQCEQLQDKVHTAGQVSVSLVGQRTQPASGVSCRVGSPNAKGVESRLYSPIYKPQRADASTQVNNTIATTIRNRSAPKHISATLQHRSLSTPYSSQPQLLYLRSLLATAPMASPEVRKIVELFIAAMDGDIVLERNPDFEAPLEAIHDKMMVNEQFLEWVIAFVIAKLGLCYPLAMAESSLTMAGYPITEDDASSSNQSSCLGGDTTVSKAPGPKFNMKTCTHEELKGQYNASKAQAKIENKRLLSSISKCSSLEEDAKALKEQRDHWKAISSSVPGAKTVANLSTKWLCTFCGLQNDSWADLTEWAPGKAPKAAKPIPEEAGVPASNKITWAQTGYCRHCGRHKSGSQPEQNAELPSKRKLADVTEGGSITNDEDQFKRHCQNIVSELKTAGHAVPTTQSLQVRLADLPASGRGAKLRKAPLTNQHMANISQGKNNSHNSSAQYLPDVNGTIADQQCFPSINGTFTNPHYFPNANGPTAGQQYFPTSNGTNAGQQYCPTGNGTISDQGSPSSSDMITDQQCSPSLTGTDAGQNYLPSTNVSIADQQYSPSLTGTNAGQNYLPSTNSSVADQQLVPNMFGIYTDQFAGEGDLFDDFDFDALPGDSQDLFSMVNWLEVPSYNTSAMTSAASETPNASSPNQITLPFTSATLSSVGNSKESPIEINDVPPVSQDPNYVLAIPQEDLNIIHSIRNEKSYEPAAKTPAKPQSNAKGKHAKPGVKYDMRGNQIGPATLPTIRYRKPMAPRTAKVGPLMFPASAAPNDAPQTTQHPKGG